MAKLVYLTNTSLDGYIEDQYGGKPALPAGFRTHLELLDEQRFNNGVVRLLYRITS